METPKTDEGNEIYWFPTPQIPGIEREHIRIQTPILNELRELEQLEQLNPLEETRSISIQLQLGRLPFTIKRQTSR